MIVAPSFQIAIVLYNSAEWIERCLDSIARCPYELKSVVVVDNQSKDNGAEIVQSRYSWVKLVRSGANLGFAGGNNLAVKNMEKGDFIFLVNPDVEIHSDCLERLAEAFAAHPKLGVAGCKILFPDGKTLQHVGGMLRKNALSYHIGDYETDRGQYRGLIPCDYAQGAAMAVRWDLWMTLGGLDEQFFPAYYEESDFCKRAKNAGWEIATVCEASVIHHQDPVAQVQSKNFLTMLFRGRARYLKKHYSPLDWLFRFLPSEIKWLMSKRSKGYRRIALKALWEIRMG